MIQFNFNRFRALVNREFYTGFRTAFKFLLIIVLAIFIIGTITAAVNPTDEPINVIISFGLILMIGGALITSLSFYEFRKLQSRAQFLSIPASSLEKWSVKWLFTNPIYILITSLVFLILASIFIPIIEYWSPGFYENEIFTSIVYWRLVGIYFIIHSIFFIGSIVFNRGAFVKTLLTLIVVAVILAAINMIFFRIIFHEYFDSLFRMNPPHGNVDFGVKYKNFDDIPQIKFFIFIFKYLLAPVIWVASLFKLSEKEI